MDSEYIQLLRKSLEDMYLLKYTALMNAKDLGEFREIQGYIKAIKAFGEAIEDNREKMK